MSLRARKLVEYYCTTCGYSTTKKPMYDICPSCNDGKGYSWDYEDGLDQARADSLEGGE
jgi:lipopolysaccharide biosynthesis regulator YciM